jgi:phosphoribosylanthranilate isomerase
MTATLWVKVCGLRTEADVAAAAHAGADAVGFVFHPPSPRHLEASEARALARAVPEGLARVAVFLRPAQADVDVAIAAVDPQWVQADAEALAALELPPGVRALPVLRTSAALAMDRLPPRCLLESGRSGAGERADWSVAAAAARRSEVVLAGGLDAGNVGIAIAAVRPWGVDVSTGVERPRGTKDARLILGFVEAARAAAARLS